MLRRADFSSISEAVQLLEKQLKDEKVHQVEERLVIEEIEANHDFGALLETMKVKLGNTFRNRRDQETGEKRSTAHSFSYKRRMDLTAPERDRILQCDEVGHAEDIFCVAKGRMFHSESESHRPVLVLPKDRVSLFPDPAQHLQLEAPRPMQPNRKKELESLAQMLDGESINQPRGATAVRNLIAKDSASASMKSDVSWFSHEGQNQHPALVVTGNRYYPHLPEISWPLLATFR